MGISLYDVVLLSPLIILTMGSLIIPLIEVFEKDDWPRGGMAGAVIVFALVFTIFMWDFAGPGTRVFSGLVYVDYFSVFVGVIILVGSLLALLMGMDRLTHEGIEAKGEYYSLLLMSTIGALIFASAAEFITLFLGLEIMSMALYCLCGSALSQRRSAESAMKYFFLGSFSSAFLLYGIAIIYGLTGTTVISEVAVRLAEADGVLLYIGVGLILVGFAFKIGAVPFHFWAPDVYEGAPTPITAYMASVVKASAVVAALRVLWTSFDTAALFEVWSGVVWIMALLTMVIGNLIALRQRSVKRMLAYSSVGHAGYVLVALLAPSTQYGGGAAALYYLVAYTFMTLGAFGVVMLVSPSATGEGRSDDITNFNRLGYRNPFLAVLLSLFLLSLAGLPPGMAGLLGKFYVFNAAIKAGYVGLAVIGVLCSALSCFYYLRVIVAMYFMPAEQDSHTDEDQSLLIQPGFSMSWALNLCAFGVVVLGIFPSVVYDSATIVMQRF